ncbi:hemopexin repeat-containing protein [Belliella marina]|uniref:Hemopexin repeat-containing protein n=1 Tax=Belliella marina TaxID=1644146 RepID=A0ABW4VTL3_9BACT
MKTVLLFTENYEKSLNELIENDGQVTQKLTDSVFVANLPEDLKLDVLKYSSEKLEFELDELSNSMIQSWSDIENKQKTLVNRDVKEFHGPDNLIDVIKSTIDAAFTQKWDGRIYFFKGDQYVKLSEDGSYVETEYPKSIKENWPGLPPSFQKGVDAVLMRDNEKIYMFKGDQYIRYSEVSKGIDEGYPKKIAGHWPDDLPVSFKKGIDAAFTGKWDGRIYFFKDEQYVRLSEDGLHVDAGYPKSIKENWPGLPETFQEGIDTVLMRDNNKIYMFKGDQYIRYSAVPKGIDEGYPKPVASNWLKYMKEIAFSFSKKPDPDSSGIQTSVAINNTGKVIEVHQSKGGDKLWCRTGQAYQMDVQWNASTYYDKGTTPSVCMNDKGTMVEVHKAQSWDELWCHVGQTDGDIIRWGASNKYDSGILPSIAMDDKNWCVEVHSSQGAATGLWYRLGVVNEKKKKIDWLFSNAKKYGKGYRPRIAMNNKGVVVEVHNNEVTHNTLWYTVGILDRKNNTIRWGNHIKFGNGGTQPSVALTDDGFVVEVHNSESKGTLWRHVGKVNVNDKTIEWSGSRYFDDGQAPSVACTSNSSMVIETHQAEISPVLWYSTSLIIARECYLIDPGNWMQATMDTIGKYTLREIAIPGSHDAGMYKRNGGTTFGKDCNTLTQTLSIGGQLANGSRYFDIRPVIHDDQYYTGHYTKALDMTWQGANGESIADIIKEVNGFTSKRKELIILNLSHDYNTDVGNTSYRKFNEEEWTGLFGQLSKINGLLHSEANDLTHIKLNDLIADGSKVIIVIEGLNKSKLGKYYQKGFFTSCEFNVYNQYADTNSVSQMMVNQIKKMKENPSAYFLLSWTLTQSDGEAAGCFLFPNVDSILDLAKTANANLYRAFHQVSSSLYPNIVYIDKFDSPLALSLAMYINAFKSMVSV